MTYIVLSRNAIVNVYSPLYEYTVYIHLIKLIASPTLLVLFTHLLSLCLLLLKMLQTCLSVGNFLFVWNMMFGIYRNTTSLYIIIYIFTENIDIVCVCVCFNTLIHLLPRALNAIRMDVESASAKLQSKCAAARACKGIQVSKLAAFLFHWCK